jgi:N-acetyl-S-(2-succino)cysteine monooxygenase
MERRQIKLSAFIASTGHHPAAWRHPTANLDGLVHLPHWVELAQTAERGKFDLLFLADGAGVVDMEPEVLARFGQPGGFEPLTLLSALAVMTRHIGLVATVSTTFSEPYTVARQFASLDHLSGGRAGWNVVTSQGDFIARNYSRESMPTHDDRYERAAEYLEVAKGLWDSWDDDAFRAADPDAGLAFDPEALHVLGHRGEHFSVRGPLNVPRPVQGHPLIVQAGASDDGRELAARTAEMVYTPAQTLDLAQAYYADVKGRMERYGRDPSELLIAPGIFPVVGDSAADARRRYDELQQRVDPAVGLSLLSMFAGGFDLTKFPLDGPLPELPPSEQGQGRMKLLAELAQRENLTLRELYLRFAMVRGHRLVVGTAEQIADELEEWFDARGADAFNVVPPLPSGLTEFVDEVVPVLQRRGLFRTEYEGTTLRDRLGLARPQSRWQRELEVIS